MRDETLAKDLFEQCKIELRNIDDLHNMGRQVMHPSDVAARYVKLFECRERVLLIMERLAIGDVPRGKTSWDKINNGDGP